MLLMPAQCLLKGCRLQVLSEAKLCPIYLDIVEVLGYFKCKTLERVLKMLSWSKYLLIYYNPITLAVKISKIH